MSSLLSAPKMATTAVNKVASAGEVADYANDTKKKIRKPTGRSNALLAGVANAMKSRLGS